MILLIRTQRLDARLLALDVAGLPLGRQLSLQRQQLGDPDLWTADGWAAFAECRDGLLTGAAAGANLLTMETDICISASDGVTSQRTHIAANVYVGSGSQLVAPIHVGEGAVIAAGSTITRDAPAGKLTLARSRQVTVAKREGGVPESRDE